MTSRPTSSSAQGADTVKPYADITWMNVLQSLNTRQMFLQQGHAGASGPEALRFLLKDPRFPRSVEHCLTAVSRCLLELPAHHEPMAACAAVQSQLEDADVEPAGPGRPPPVHRRFAAGDQPPARSRHRHLLRHRARPVRRCGPPADDRALTLAIHAALEHRTVYRFDRSIRLSPHVVRLRPAPSCRTPILAYSMRIEPEEHFINWQQDPFGNHLARLVFPEPASLLSVTVDMVAEMTVVNPFDFFLDPDAERYPFRYDAALARDLAPYLTIDEPGRLLHQWLAEVEVPAEGLATVDFLVGVNQRVQQAIAYSTRFEPGVQTAEETLEKGVGSCRDSAWLLTQILRGLGLAARFVSGYLVQLKADEAPLEGQPGPSVDFTDLHAWSEVYVPGAGWIGLDPTSGLFAGEGHLPLACTPDPASAAPVTGEIEPCDVVFEYANVVRRVHEDPRVTFPYTEDQWAGIDALGRSVDGLLVDGDVRLTHGGEPTFVSVDGTEAAEWSTAADGAQKRATARALTDRLAERFSSGGIVHHGQGKWYPGEALPRWQMAVVWRTDGVPLWADPSLLAEPWIAGRESAVDAGHLVLAVAAELGIPPEYCVPGYEDAMYRLWTEARLPAGAAPTADVDPSDPELAESEARRRLVDALDAGRGDAVGWVVPLHHTPGAEGRWATSRWTLRRGHLLLAPGDSPMGLRLPLDSLTWAPPPTANDPSTFEARGPLPDPAAGPVGAAAAVVVPADEAPPTALCVEVRNGRLHVFLPPLERLEYAVELLAAVEAAASRLATPVVLEGYALPRDPRLREVMVGPDPGVIEVNLQPASSWPELVDIVTAVYHDARRTRLGTEKFQLDGTHTGTGGGNHMTLGGPTPADSPLLRRPDLLRSLVTYWQHHPALSYLFSGRFIGPTSQAPRVDEARDDSLYELEIAFAELDQATDLPRPWLVDRLLRNLLVDVTGNTHRAEFCIDKLFSPDTERGRLGLVELRAFEMPPHPQMALVQALLVRALVARFWEQPLRRGAGPMGMRAARPLPAPVVCRRRHRRGRRRPPCPRPDVRAGLAGPVPRVPVPSARVRAGSRHRPSSCAPPSSPGPSSARRSAGRAPPATSTRRPSGSRSWCRASPQAVTW